MDIFNREDICGRLLILGEPGAGKTTTQIELAKALIEEYVDTDPEYPIPVLLNLSSWRNEAIHDWLAEELKSKYGIPKDIAVKWIKARKLLLLLDGLDELKVLLQKPCADVLNQYLAGEQAPESTVICCRVEEYGLLKTKLQLNGAIQLKSLTKSQIQDYLNDVEQKDLWALISKDTQLLDLVQTPLMLSVTALAYKGISLEEREQTKSLEVRQQVLWDAYLRRMMNPAAGSRIYGNNQVPTQKQTRHWLTWLAHHLAREEQTEFLIEKIQPSELSSGTFKTYENILKLSAGLICGISMGSTSGIVYFFLRENNWFVEGLIDGLSVGLGTTLSYGIRNRFMTGIIFGSAYCLIYYISLFLSPPSEDFKIMLIDILTAISIGLAASIVVMVSGGLSNSIKKITITERLGWSWLKLSGRVHITLFSVLMAGIAGTLNGSANIILILIVGLATALFIGIHRTEVEEKILPNQGIWQSGTNAIIVGSIMALCTGLIYGIYTYGIYTGFYKETNLLFALKYGLTFGFLGILLFSLGSGGADCLQHFTMRFILYHKDDIPWNYARFLDHCTERSLMQRIGGRYSFIHKQLQEHFAAMPLEKP